MTRKSVKGQLISKCLFGVFKFFQKTNENKSTWGIIVVKLDFFICFLEELRIPKSLFEINWPLTTYVHPKNLIIYLTHLTSDASLWSGLLEPEAVWSGLFATAAFGCMFLPKTTAKLPTLHAGWHHILPEPCSGFLMSHCIHFQCGAFIDRTQISL